MKSPKGTIVRRNRDDEKYILDHDVVASEENDNIYRIQDRHGDWIYKKDQVSGGLNLLNLYL